MPRVFKAVDLSKEEKEAKKDYFDRHTPFILCDGLAQEGEKFKVKVRIGKQYPHPDDPDHFINYVQLWNRETFLAEAHFASGALGHQNGQVEVDFYIVPGPVTMKLSAMAVCTKHGLWQSESVEVPIRKKQGPNGNRN
ncbi:MAG: dethiobiotin synthase [Bacteroidetes bacterium]|nr:MAG: dethiobiotin synthase [Bacteroidota bacterium]